MKYIKLFDSTQEQTNYDTVPCISRIKNVSNSSAFHKYNTEVDVELSDATEGDLSTFNGGLGIIVTISHVNATGTVTLLLNENIIATKNITGDGRVSFTESLATLPAGHYDVLAIYNGDEYHNPSSIDDEFTVSSAS